MSQRGRRDSRAASPPRQFADLVSIVAPLARVAEIRALRRTSENLIDTYVGHQTGERILSGKIRRGYVEAIRAAIWLSDMRGFTSVSERVPPQALIDRLNLYFGCQVPAVLGHGGEVLKFMGDGLLAIFPIAAESEVGEVCRRTLSCAQEFKQSIAELPPPGDNEAPIRFGLALHVGEVMYGNIGGGNRLDFTCIGPAVISRPGWKGRGQARRSGCRIRHFRRPRPRRVQTSWRTRGRRFAAPQTVYGLAN